MIKKLLLYLALTTVTINYAQDAITEIYIIDAYVTPELPYTLKLTFFTSEPAQSKFHFENEEYVVSDEFTEDHTFELNLTGFKFDSTTVPYFIEVQNAEGVITKSEIYDIALPEDNELKKDDAPGLFTICCFGGVIFGFPSPTYVSTKDGDYFSLTKEIPIVTFFASGFNYPMGIIAAEYSHIFKSPRQNFLRIGYKHIFEVSYIEYISPGVNGFTDFNGLNGISPEITVGWFNVYNSFTVYTKYRFNTNFNEDNKNFHEVSIGLYSSFLSFNL